METILFLAHSEEDGSLGKAGLETLGAAASLCEQTGGQLLAGVFGGDITAAAESLGKSSANRILGVTGDQFAQSRYSTDAAAIEAICREASPTIVVTPGTSRINRSLAGVARRLSGKIDTHIASFRLDGEKILASRWFYRQRLTGEVSRSDRPWFWTIDPGTYEARDLSAGANATLEPIEVNLDASTVRSKVTGFEEPPKGEQTVRPDAEVLLVAGAGWTKKQPDGQVHAEDATELISGFLGKTGASLGGSKSVVDMGGEGQAVLPFMTHLNQIGQTGSSPRHSKGLSTCCHGEEPHVIGWRFVKERRAISLDPACGWAQGEVDVLYVADAFAVMRKLNEMI